MTDAISLRPLGIHLESSADDREFFKRHRTRKYRLRLATQSEIAELPLDIGENEFAFVAVQKITMKSRIRAIFCGPPLFAHFLRNEHFARAMFEKISMRDPSEPLMDVLTNLGCCEVET